MARRWRIVRGMTLIIPIHSFVDLITNSSSETFVAADRQTVSVLEGIIDAVLAAGGSDKKCHDLFRIGLDTEDGGYGVYKVIYVEAREPRCRLAAKAIEELSKAFVACYQENRKNDEDRYVIRANSDAPRIVEDAVNAVLGAAGTGKGIEDFVEVSTAVVKKAADEFEEDDLKLVVEPVRLDGTTNFHVVAAKLELLNSIFTAENVSSE